MKSPSFTPAGAGRGGLLYQFKLALGKMVFPMRRRELIALLLCLLILSNMATYLFTRSFFSTPALEVAGERAEGKLFWEVWDLLEDKYFQPVEKEKLLRGALEGMLRSLDDPYTAYLNPEYLEEMLIHTTGSLSGIGVEIVEDEGEILIIRVIEGTPAHYTGLLPGDHIAEVDGISMSGVDINEAARLLRGPSGTSVEVVIQRAGEKDLLQVTLTRAQIEMDTVFARFLEKGVGYLQITSFDQGTGEDFKAALHSLEKQGLEGLILDLRDNPGGLLEEAIRVGEVIVPSGEITRVVDREGNVRERYLSRAEPLEYEVIVLVNEYSASAAEIIAGALQDRGGALLVGRPTFGKATVQYLEYLSDGGGLRYTIAKYLTPAGHDLHRDGLQPDFEVKLPPEYYLQHRPVPRDLAPGDTGEKVVLLQNMLNFLDHDLEITGVFDEQTLETLKSFQMSQKISPSGELDTSTREQLRKSLAEKAAAVDEQLLFARKTLLSGKGAGK
ncbi:MAG: S41 family peptidase [Dethiobacteria bacterium]